MAKKLYKDLISTSGAYFITSGLGIIYGILFPRLLGSEQWGLWSISIGLIGLLGPLAQVAMSTTLTTYVSRYKKDKKTVSKYINSAYFVAIFSSFLVSIALILLSSYLASSVFKDERLRLFLLLGAGIIFFKQLNIINRDYFRGFKDFKKYNILKIVPELSLLLLTISFFILFSYRAIYLATAQLVIAAIVCILVFTYLIREEDVFRIFRIPNNKVTKKVLKFGIPLIFTMTFMTVMKSLDRVLIGYFLEADDVGIYSVAAGIPLMIGGMFAPITTVILPAFSERKGKGKSSEVLLRELFSLLLYVSIPLIIFLYLFSGDILYIVFGQEYILGATVLSITSIEIFLYSSKRLFGIPVVGSEKTVSYAVGLGLTALSNIVLNSILIPIYGIEGAALGTVLSFVLLFFIMLHLCKRNSEFKISSVNLKVIIPLTITFLISGIFLEWILDGLISLIITSVTFLALLFVFSELSSPLWYRELKTYIKEMPFL
ncbi:MAG: flippase [Candidatus Saliniplasma sp.]